MVYVKITGKKDDAQMHNKHLHVILAFYPKARMTENRQVF
jgi:hypothetical protein